MLFYIFAVKLANMEELIYVTSDNSAMTRDDLMNWLKLFYKLHPEYSDWNFDEITGGKEYFFDLKEYNEIKEFFKKNILRNESRHCTKNRKSIKELEK